jgi:hypothetical protein
MTIQGVAYAAHLGDGKIDLSSIHLLDDWGPGMPSQDRIPSVISYSPSLAGELQWGNSLSPDAVVMKNTKLELDVLDNKSDELDLTLQTLDGVKNLDFEGLISSGGFPEYTWKPPEHIVTDYLSKVFQVLKDHLDPVWKTRVFGGVAIPVPVDVVITVPRVCTSSFLPLRSPLLTARTDLVIQGEECSIQSSQAGGFQRGKYPKLGCYDNGI